MIKFKDWYSQYFQGLLVSAIWNLIRKNYKMQNFIEFKIHFSFMVYNFNNRNNSD